jgi:hypothetical protein
VLLILPNEKEISHGRVSRKCRSAPGSLQAALLLLIEGTAGYNVRAIAQCDGIRAVDAGVIKRDHGVRPAVPQRSELESNTTDVFTDAEMYRRLIHRGFVSLIDAQFHVCLVPWLSLQPRGPSDSGFIYGGKLDGAPRLVRRGEREGDRHD